MNYNHHRRYGQHADAKITVDEAWKLCQWIPAIREDHEGQANLFK
jgi:hypothetical protein